MGTTPATFSGTSTYAADLQQAITHAVAIASLPLEEVQRSVTTLQGQANELNTLQGKFLSFQGSILSLASATGGSGSLTTSISNGTVASATISSSADVTPGTYTLNVINTGAPTTTLSTAGVADPTAATIGAGGNYTLSVNGGATLPITPTANTLTALAQAINLANAGVSATIVNVGSPTSPSYKLSLQTAALGDITVDLQDSGHSSLLGVLTHGAQAQYQVDGQPTASPFNQASTDTITIAPGVTVDLLHSGITNITVAANPLAASNALSSFAASYNAAIDELAQNHGTAGGALTGDSTVFQLGQALRDLTGFTGGSGTVQSLTDLGLVFDQTGHLNFDQTQFANVASANPGDVAAFLGSPTGSGFLATATNVMNSLEDTSTGIFQGQQNTIQQQIAADNLQVASIQNRISTMQAQLTAQMSKADAAIAALQSKVTYFTNLFVDEQNAIRAQTLG